MVGQEGGDGVGSSRELSPSTVNLLVLASVILLVLWFCRLLRTVLKLYGLSMAVSSDQIMRTRAGSLALGEMEMLWSTNMQQQVLRARRAERALPVPECRLAFCVQPSSCKLCVDEEEGDLGIDFTYTAACRVDVQLFWNVPFTALDQCVERLNQGIEGGGGHLPSPSRRKKQRFGLRYTAVDDEEDEGLEGTRMTVVSDGSSSCVSSGRKLHRVPFFGDSECLCRSSVTPLSQGESLRFGCPDTARVGVGLQELVRGYGQPEHQPAIAALRGGDVHPLVIVVGVDAAANVESLGDGDAVCAQMISASFDSRGGVVQFARQYAVTSRAAYLVQEMYGEKDGDGAHEECVICLTDLKDTVLLPCRHLCVCSRCFSRLEACPVCRSTFTAYLRTKPPPAQHEEDLRDEGLPLPPRMCLGD